MNDETLALKLTKAAAIIYGVAIDDVLSLKRHGPIMECRTAIRYYFKCKGFDFSFISKYINPNTDRTSLYHSMTSFNSLLCSNNESLIKYIEFINKAERIINVENHIENVSREAAIRLLRMKQMQIVRYLKSHMGEPITPSIIHKVTLYDPPVEN